MNNGLDDKHEFSNSYVLKDQKTKNFYLPVKSLKPKKKKKKS